MKIGITADAHLTTKQEYPERFNAFSNILEQCNEMGIKNLIIAGDLFNQNSKNYSEFEAICNKPELRQMILHLIPGNHDMGIRQEHFGYPNIIVYCEPTWLDFGTGWDFLFIPYEKNKSMGEVIEKNIEHRNNGKWSLISHGDWYAGLISPNPYEPGIYMPITSKDISIYQPTQIFLGHIHKPLDFGNLHYPGSPCPLDITETGYRRFLSFDLEANLIESYTVQTDVIFFTEELIVLPTEDETSLLRFMIDRSIQGWGLAENDKKKVRLRLRCRGYSSDKARLLETIKEAYHPFQFDAEPDISEVSSASDLKRDYLLEKVKEYLGALEWTEKDNEPGREDILLDTMHLIYGEV